MMKRRLLSALRKPRITADFRSDTLTWPTQSMLEYAMNNCSLGDDVYEEDESTQKLESLVAQLAGKEAGLFCTSGTMSNQLALRSRLGPLENILLDGRSHIYQYENSGHAHHSQAGTRIAWPTENKRWLTVADIEREAITEPDVHWTQTKVICLENTLNGAIYPLPEVEQISEYARIHSIWTHMDGARLWHAAAETRLPISQWCRLVDSASLCLSKGIGAPVGSVLVGPSDFIRRCRHFRKLFGGGWRQSGPLAAMAEFALNRQFIDCQQGQVLRRVHENARRLGEELERTIPSLRVVPDCGGTNMLFVDIRRGNGKGDLTVAELSQRVTEQSQGQVKIASGGYGLAGVSGSERHILRLVLHYQHTEADCDILVASIKNSCL